jgi:predicted RNase H-like nuclease (RuvC/YqgF family)
MADLRPTTQSLVSSAEYADLRAPVVITDTKSKTEAWLKAQIHERISSIEAFKGQVAHLQGMLEIKEDELEELRARLAKLNLM